MENVRYPGQSYHSYILFKIDVYSSEFCIHSSTVEGLNRVKASFDRLNRRMKEILQDTPPPPSALYEILFKVGLKDKKVYPKEGLKTI